MDLRNTQIKDTYGNLVTIGSVAGTPTTGTLQNGAGSDITSLTLNGAAVVSGNILLGNTSNLASGTGVISQLQIASVSASLGGMMLQNATNNNGAPAIYSTKTRSGTIGNYTTAVVNGDFLMFVDGEGSDGVSALRRAGSISINAAGTFTPTSSPGYITFNTTPSGSVSTSERLRIDSAGNVGIGTSSPTAKLSVDGSAVFNEAGADVDFRVEGDTDANLLFVDASADRVGIGTSSPATKLEVVGTVTADGLTVDGNATINAATPILYFTETDTTDLNTRVRNAAGNFQISTANDALNSFTARVNIDHSTGDISFYEDTGTTPKFFWDASAEALGIGTSSPAVKLDVSGQVRASTGILFGTDTAAANALDDYEEGTWTATLASGATTTPTGLTAGFYTKVGRVVNAVIATSFGSITVNGTPIVITGLPFTSAYGNTQTAMGTTGRAQYQASAIHAWQIENSTELHAIYIPANTGTFSDLLSEASGTYTPTFYVNITYMA